MTNTLNKIINSFCPRWILGLSLRKNWQRNHWISQIGTMEHGYAQYDGVTNRHVIVANILQQISPPGDYRILELGCSTGEFVNLLREKGYGMVHGVDINFAATYLGASKYNFRRIPAHIHTSLISSILNYTLYDAFTQPGHYLITSSFEDFFIFVPGLYRVTITFGATLEVTHPSFDIIKKICDNTSKYVILVISENGHDYPRFWEYEFNKHGFKKIIHYYPIVNNSEESLLIFEREDDN